ncbi:hypothetical protein CKA32_000245 [Geitlerinema sp. FC II]|nr:hypothetical protein CKA32_000245 [Geitlerinema sp. FC II]
MSGWAKPVFESSTPLGLNAERSRSERSRSERSRSVEIRIPYQPILTSRNPSRSPHHSCRRSPTSQLLGKLAKPRAGNRPLAASGRENCNRISWERSRNQAK